MSNNTNTVIKHRLSLLNLAQELSNISKAYEQGGLEALIDSNRRVPNVKNRLEPAVESAIKAYAI